MATLDCSTPSVDNDLFAHYGRHIIAHFINDTLRANPASESTAQDALDKAVLCSPGSRGPVGILGAGASGLYTALILLDLGIPFKIIEARDRVGGRLFTHTFESDLGKPYNYYDVGAMRFPEHISMRRLFHLFQYPPLNEGDLQLHAKLRPYHFSDKNGNDLRSYNGETLKVSDVKLSSFQPQAVMRDVDPTPYIAAGFGSLIGDVVEPFARRLYNDLKYGTHVGWDYLMSFDHCSARAYMSILYRPSAKLQKDFNVPNKPLSVDVINWVETFDNSTGAYDRALSETVLDTVAFGWTPSTGPLEPEPTEWHCIDGGAFQIASTMYEYVKRKGPDAIVFKKRVTAIGTDESANAINVTTDDGNVESFSHVISSIPLPVLRTVDLTGAGLNPMQSNAIRQLTYGPSVKVGMHFRSAWWTTATNRAGVTLNIVGGQTYSDSPLRTVVYPSFGDAENGKTTTLIASYSWTDDADRLGALATNEELKPVLEDLVLRELARIHDFDMAFLREQLLETHAWSWPHDPCTMGAFAFFGPGKFANVYQSLTTPAGGGRLHFAGEAISTRHAWVEGALDSAWRGVFELLITEPAWNPLLPKFFSKWGCNGEWFSGPEPVRRAPPKSDEGVPNRRTRVGVIPVSGRSPVFEFPDADTDTDSPVFGIPDGQMPVSGVPMGRWDLEMGQDEGGELDVDKLLKSSLLPKHIALTSQMVF